MSFRCLNPSATLAYRNKKNAVTNMLGAGETTAIRIFVNKSGNHPPSAPQVLITLPTNVYTTNINALANATDSDGNTISFVGVTKPKWGILVTNTSGDITYTRKPNYFAQDSFDYFLTDTNGGLARIGVVISLADADNDGMPDEWENLMGLNTATDDSLSDPDEDGIANLAEYKLGTVPRMADNPINLESITTGQAFSNYARVPISLNAQIEKPAISLLINGDAANAFLQQSAVGSWYFNWDTGYLTNGNYSIAASFHFNPNAEPPTPGSITGLTKNVRVTNEVIFDQLNSGFSDFWTIHISFAYHPANWRIELYDEDGSGLVYFDGTDTDGQLYGSWDLRNGGQQISYGNIHAYIYSAPAGQGLPSLGSRSAAKANRWFTKETPGGIGDSFVLAWGWNSYSSGFTERRENLMLDGIINIIANPSLDDEYALLPIGNAFSCCAFRYDTPADKEVLKNALANSAAGNFFWLGHGDVDAIQGNAKKSTITDGDVENLLQNKKHRSRQGVSFKNKHPYRLVILNSCKTYSSDWANAFGIDFTPGGSTNIVFEYQWELDREPQAFVGWTDEIIIPGYDPTGGGHIAYAQALAELFSRWMGGYPLNLCLEFFADTAVGYSFNNQDKWRISGCIDLQRTNP